MNCILFKIQTDIKDRNTHDVLNGPINTAVKTSEREGFLAEEHVHSATQSSVHSHLVMN